MRYTLEKTKSYWVEHKGKNKTFQIILLKAKQNKNR